MQSRSNTPPYTLVVLVVVPVGGARPIVLAGAAHGGRGVSVAAISLVLLLSLRVAPCQHMVSTPLYF